MNGLIRTLARVGACAAALAVAVLTASCTPGSEITAAESDVVATLYDGAFDFGAIQSYALPDSIIHITGDTDDADSPLLSRAYDDEIIARIAGELDAMGWTRVTDPSTADVVVLVGATARVDLASYSPWYGYWGWYYPYPGGWSWYYPYPVVSYNYTIGTLVILMTDLDSANPNTETYEVPWVAAINGVLDDDTADKQSRISRGIAQAFDQSPYLSD
jgi:Domain of unknown function (DUF4136)